MRSIKETPIKYATTPIKMDNKEMTNGFNLMEFNIKRPLEDFESIQTYMLSFKLFISV
jgi:hypothetical protein